MKRVLSLMLALVLILEQAGPALAAELGPEEVLYSDLFTSFSEIQSRTATLSSIALSKTPGTVSVITAKQLRDLGVTTIEEAIRYMPGVDIVRSPMGMAGNIRGMGGDPFQSGMQFLIDGYIYNSPDKGGSPALPTYSALAVPIEMVKQIEVIREPISSIYGPNAYFGVINIITKDGADFEKEGQTLSLTAGDKATGLATYRYLGAMGGAGEKVSWAAAADFHRRWSDRKFREESGLEDTKGMVKLKAGNFGVFGLNQYTQNEKVFMGSNVTTRVKAPPQTQNVFMTGVEYSKDITPIFSLNSKTSYLARKGSNCQTCHNPNFTGTSNNKSRYEMFQRFYEQFHAKVTATEKQELTFGTELIYDREHMDTGVRGSPRAKNATIGFFGQDFVKFRDNLSMTLGLRYDATDWSNTGPLWSPRALFVFSPWERLTWRTGYTMAHRVPAFHDQNLFMRFFPTVTGNSYEFGDPNIKPETIQTFNLGQDFWVSKNFLFRLNGFYSMIRNQIDRKRISNAELRARMGGVFPDGTPIPVNPAVGGLLWTNNPVDAGIAGGEVEMIMTPWRFLSLNMNYSYKNVDYERDVAPAMGSTSHAPNAPHNKAAAILSLYPTEKSMLSFAGRYRGKYWASYTIQTSAQPFPLPTKPAGQMYLVDIHARYEVLKGLSVSLMANNIFNQQKYEWIVPPDNRLTGREYMGKVEYKFGANPDRK